MHPGRFTNIDLPTRVKFLYQEILSTDLDLETMLFAMQLEQVGFVQQVIAAQCQTLH